jgi:hypothetical protein
MIFWSLRAFIWFKNMKKKLLQMTSGFLQLESTIDGNATAVDSDLFSLISYRFSASFHFCRVEGFFGKNSALIEKDNTSQIEIFN